MVAAVNVSVQQESLSVLSYTVLHPHLHNICCLTCAGTQLNIWLFFFFLKVCLCNKFSCLSKKMLVVKRSHCCDKAVVVSVSDWMTRAPLLWTWTLNFVLFREENFLTYTPMSVSHPLHQLCMTPWNKDMKKRFWQCLFISDFNLQFVHKSHQ